VRTAALVVALATSPVLRGAEHAQGQVSNTHVNAKVIEVGRLHAITDAGIAVGDNFVYANGKTWVVLGPLAHGVGTSLVSANSRGQILVAQKVGPWRYFIYDINRKDFTSVGLTAQVGIDGVAHTVELGYLTGFDDEGRIFGVFVHGQTLCAAVGKPTLGTPGDIGTPPTTPANFDFIGCPGARAVIRSVNSTGEIVGDYGKQAFKWSDGKLTPFAFPGSLQTQATAINDAGVVVGNFMPGYTVSSDGDVSPVMRPGMRRQTGYIYDGQNFRYVTLPGIAPAVTLGGINNRGQIIGHFREDRSFVAEVNSFPIVQMPATPSELTAATVDRKLATRRTEAASGGDTDQAYRILQTGIGQGPALTLRALQALEAAGPLSNGKRVRVTNTVWMTYDNISLETVRAGVINQLLNALMKQLSRAQGSLKDIDTVVDAVDALAGEQGLRDLRAAGELAPFGQPVLNSPQNQFTSAARAKLKNTLLSAIASNLAAHPIKIPPSNVEVWQPSTVTAGQLDALTNTVRQIKEELGVPTAAIFLAWSEVRESNVGGSFDWQMVEGAPNVGGLFDWQVVDDLVGLNTRGEQARAEQVLRSLAEAPEPAKCPGLDALRASRTYKEDGLLTFKIDPSPRAELAQAIEFITGQKIRAIYSERREPASDSN